MPETTASSRKNPDRFFHRLLHFYPADFRAEWGGEMEELFAARRRREPLGRLLWEITLDTFKTAPKEHLAMLIQDIKYALRGLRNNPGFTAVAILSLALGIGANSSVYSLANALLLRPLSVPDSSGLLLIEGTRKGGSEPQAISHPDYLELRAQAKSFQAIAASSETRFGFAARREEAPQLKLGTYVSANFFDVIGVPPALGRTFRADEDEAPARDAVAIVSHALWNDSFQADPSVLGRKILLNGVELTVIGVAGEGFGGVRNGISIAVYVPIMMSAALAPTPAQAIPGRRESRSLSLRGRLHPGIANAAANAEIITLGHNLEAANPDVNHDRGARVRTELQFRIDQSPTGAIVMASQLAITLLVLLIACVNVANLLLARGRARAREVAVRLALGASRARLLRELMTESFLLALGGGILGLLLAVGGAAYFSTIRPPSDFPLDFNVRVDSYVLIFNLILSFTSAFLFGLIPAWRSLQPDLVSGLKGGDQGFGRNDWWGRHSLATAQIAISCVLLIAAAMMIAGIRGNLVKEIGFRTERVFLATVDPELLKYSVESSRQLYDRLLDRVRVLPGVRSATLASTVPTSSGGRFTRIVPEGYLLPHDQSDVAAFETSVAEDYFDTIGIPVLAGRAILKSDTLSTPKVAIVNETLANMYWPGQNAVGKRLNKGGVEYQVIGLARNTKYTFVGEGPVAAIYVATRQEERQGRLTLMAHTDIDSAALTAPIRETVRGLDSNLPLSGVRTMADYHEQRTAGIVRLIVNPVSALGFIGLTLALIGLYGTMSYSVSRRKKEIGIRIAIGAAPASILGLVLRQGAWMAGIGIAVGTAIGIAASQAMEKGFLGMAVAHPAVFFVVPALLAAAALAACWIPARRAASTDPTLALRCD